MMQRRSFFSLAVAAILAFTAAPAQADSAGRLEAEADATLKRLVATQPVTQGMIERAAGILIFPEIVKGGLIVGAAAGKGPLRVGGRTEGYYRSSAVSYGLQAGVATFGYVMFFMDEASLQYLRNSSGWEVGVGPNVTVADAGVAGRLSTTTVQDGIYVFFVDQKGFFAGAGIEGSKITQIAE